ncbi:hypothetical protein LWI29_001149 [Acer saccharum]|uniref:Malectin domain-containing protein n=1 Tax=Acer saccharum TaxID=4024 RepID=A0AA39SZC2_ACESA|nr:hypothetical protein LWI29_001149 [Acer saccharum]
MGNEDANSLATNEFDLNVTGADYYKTARLSLESLKYYGLCMRKGSYKVMLHFAEIMFTDDQTFASHGRRIFDVSIQGKLVLKDFNIAEEAGGVGIGITKEFNDVWVNGSTLEVHLYWAGKGTTSIPEKGVYGPLISAITITPNFEVHTRGLSAGAIVGIIVASCAAVVLLFVLLWMKGCFGEKDLENKGVLGWFLWGFFRVVMPVPIPAVASSGIDSSLFTTVKLGVNSSSVPIGNLGVKVSRAVSYANIVKVLEVQVDSVSVSTVPTVSSIPMKKWRVCFDLG